MDESQKDNVTKSLTQRAKGWLCIALFITVVVYSFYSAFIKTSNEVGFLGMDKVGRQVFIQSLDSFLDPNVNVDSDFFDHNFVSRILIQEPMRTTLKFDIRDEKEFVASPKSVDAFLAAPASKLTDMYKSNITMQENYEMTPDELRKSVNDKGVQNIEDLLSGFGFKRFEVYSRGVLIKKVDLLKTKNVMHAG